MAIVSWFPASSEAGAYLRLIDSCITQLKAQGHYRTCIENKEEEQYMRFMAIVSWFSASSHRITTRGGTGSEQIQSTQSVPFCKKAFL